MRSGRSCSARARSAPRRWPSTSPKRSATVKARGAPRSTSRPATRSTSRRRSAASRPRRSTRCWAPRWPREAGTRRLIGVRAQGMTACPCAQTLVEARSRERLQADGFSDDEIERIFEHVPVATHNQRGLGTLHIGCPEDCDTDIDAAVAGRHRRGLDVLGDLRADEALRRGRGGREGAPAATVRRGLRAGDDPRHARPARLPHRAALRLRAPGEPRDDPPAQRPGRAVRPDRRAAAARSRPASTRCTTCRCASGWTG